MSRDLLSATLAPVRVTEATRASVAEVAAGLGVSEADVVRLSLRFYLKGWQAKQSDACGTCGSNGMAMARQMGLFTDTPAGDA